MIDTNFFNLLKEFVFEIYPLAKEALNKKIFLPPTYDKYPRLLYGEEGLPSIDEFGDKPKDISSVFRSYVGKPDIELENYDSFLQCQKYIVQNSYFSKITLAFYSEDEKQRLYGIKCFLIKIIERYHLLKEDDGNDEILLEKIYAPLEYGAFNERFYIDIAIPLPYLNFSFDEYCINDKCCIRKISDDYHKARFFITNSSIPISNKVISCASHEFVLKNWYIDSLKGAWLILFSCDKESYYPIHIFDDFITAIKIISNINSGYAQVLIYPHEWACHYNMDLPALEGMAIKKYPGYFENSQWPEKELPCINIKEITQIGKIFEILQECTENKIRLACKRLRYSFMREDEEDSILDIMIALEILLTDEEKNEVTHKLSLRLSKLISLFEPDYDPLVVFKSMKKIYGYRSKIVHGCHKPKNKSQELKENEKGFTEQSKYKDLANDYLRILIRILLNHKEYLDVKEIDKKMIVD